MAIEHKVVACEKQNQIEKLRRESTEKQQLGDGLIKGQQMNGKFTNH